MVINTVKNRRMCHSPEKRWHFRTNVVFLTAEGTRQKSVSFLKQCRMYCKWEIDVPLTLCAHSNKDVYRFIGINNVGLHIFVKIDLRIPLSLSSSLDPPLPLQSNAASLKYSSHRRFPP